MVKVAVVLVIGAVALEGCGRNDSDSGNSGGSGGAGAAGTGGEGGGRSFAVCDDIGYPDPRGMSACAPPPPDSSVPEAPTEFVVVGTVSGCVPSLWVGDMSPNQGWVGWELEDGTGKRWSVTFAIGMFPDSLLSIGDNVVVRRDATQTQDNDPDSRGSRGYIAVERGGEPVIFLANSVLPTFEAVPDFAVNVGPIVCARAEDVECGARASLEVVANGETVTLGKGETAETSGFVFRSGGAQDNSECQPEDLYNTFVPADYLLAGFRQE